MSNRRICAEETLVYDSSGGGFGDSAPRDGIGGVLPPWIHVQVSNRQICVRRDLVSDQRPHWGARSTCHGKVSCLYLTASPQGCPKARLWDHFSLPFTPPRWALSSARMVFPTTVMPMILNCFCLSLLRTPRSRRGFRTVSLIYPHG